MKWLEELPPLNLLNWPTQPGINHHQLAIREQLNWIDLSEEEADKIAIEIECKRGHLEYLNIDIEKSRQSIEHHRRMIKDKQWLYYLRTGRIV